MLELIHTKIDFDVLHIILASLIPVMMFSILYAKESFLRVFFGFACASWGSFIVVYVLTFGKWIKMLAYVQNLLFPWMLLREYTSDNFAGLLFLLLPWFFHSLCACLYVVFIYSVYDKPDENHGLPKDKTLTTEEKPL